MHDLAARIREAADAIRQIAGQGRPRIGIIFGTGLSSLRKEIVETCSLPYDGIPGFVQSTVESHHGELVFGSIEGLDIVAMCGRFHVYEGYTFQEVTFPVRVMKALGIETLIVSNACGMLNPQWTVGDIMVMDDHIDLMNGNPLTGPNDPDLGVRFPDMSRPYDPELIRLALEAGRAEGVRLEKGVYAAVTGPNLETRAEYRFLRTIGADVIGMSTIPEVIVAVHSGLRVLGFSIMTDGCLPDALHPARIEDILAVAAKAETRLNRVVRHVLRALAGHPAGP